MFSHKKRRANVSHHYTSNFTDKVDFVVRVQNTEIHIVIEIKCSKPEIQTTEDQKSQCRKYFTEFKSLKCIFAYQNTEFQTLKIWIKHESLEKSQQSQKFFKNLKSKYVPLIWWLDGEGVKLGWINLVHVQ